MPNSHPVESIEPMATTLLIVDDHDGFRAAASALFRAAGFDVVAEANTGQSAIDAVQHWQPDVVLLDVMLPDLDGFAVCEQITTGNQAPQVVLTSSRHISNYRTSIEHSRARGFIPKSELSGPALAALLG
jgi:DNA-binding NarL/FixJ family response regulator